VTKLKSIMLKITIHERIFACYPDYARHIVLAVQVNNHGIDCLLTQDVVARLLSHNDLEKLSSLVPSNVGHFIRNPHRLCASSEKIAALTLSIALRFGVAVYAEDLARCNRIGNSG
jgi:hypothetical protein